MKEPDYKEVEKHLAAVIGKQRKEVIGYTVLTLLCTPVFVVIASVMVFFIFVLMSRNHEFLLSASAIYTGLNIFLGSMIMFVLRYSNPPEEPHEFDIGWLAAVGFFLVLLILTYSSGFQQQFPVIFGIVYAVMGLFIMGLLGYAYMNNPVPEESNTENPFGSLFLLVSAFIAMSYGEIFRGSWLFFPPKPDEIRVSAWILCRLTLENTWRLGSRTEERRVLSILARLKLVKMTENKLRLTPKGRDFVNLGIDF
ncbi:MAG: hypothetical protein GY845_31840 [Planctomycetes bacterium]|nr:hypothetical protein [Planctomycetota bacterium]